MDKKHILTAVILVMLAYQAWRVFDYIQGSLTGVDQDTSFWIALAFLTFTEIGLLVWLHVAQPRATTVRQENVANVMVWVDYFGSMILGLADLAKHNTIYDINLTRIDPILFFAPWVIVLLNVGAWIVYTTNESSEILARADRRLKHAEHELENKARMDAIAMLHAESEGLARQLAPQYVKDIKDRVTGTTLKKFNREADKLPDVPVLPAPKKETARDKVARLIAGNQVIEKIIEPAGVLSNGNGNGHKSQDGEDINPTMR